jgi:hypothetical protein
LLQGRDSKHLTRALAITGSDDGRVNVEEAALVEKAMNGK